MDLYDSLQICLYILIGVAYALYAHHSMPEEHGVTPPKAWVLFFIALIAFWPVIMILEALTWVFYRTRRLLTYVTRKVKG